MKTFHVDYERDEDGWWVASVRDVEGCHTQGRSIEQAQKRIREALEAFLDDPSEMDGAEFVDHVNGSQ